MGDTDWEFGSPTSGPNAPYRGEAAAGTRLDGPYYVDSEVSLISPVIDLTGMESAVLTFYHYVDLEYDDEQGIAWDVGTIFLLDAQGERLAIPPLLEVSGQNNGWKRQMIALPQEALDNPFKLEFNLLSDGFGEENDGWYLDEIEID
jgi:bacillopeptidase F